MGSRSPESTYSSLSFVTAPSGPHQASKLPRQSSRTDGLDRPLKAYRPVVPELAHLDVPTPVASPVQPVIADRPGHSQPLATLLNGSSSGSIFSASRPDGPIYAQIPGNYSTVPPRGPWSDRPVTNGARRNAGPEGPRPLFPDEYLLVPYTGKGKQKAGSPVRIDSQHSSARRVALASGTGQHCHIQPNRVLRARPSQRRLSLSDETFMDPVKEQLPLVNGTGKSSRTPHIPGAYPVSPPPRHTHNEVTTARKRDPAGRKPSCSTITEESSQPQTPSAPNSPALTDTSLHPGFPQPSVKVTPRRPDFPAAYAGELLSIGSPVLSNSTQRPPLWLTDLDRHPSPFPAPSLPHDVDPRWHPQLPLARRLSELTRYTDAISPLAEPSSRSPDTLLTDPNMAIVETFRTGEQILRRPGHFELAILNDAAAEAVRQWRSEAKRNVPGDGREQELVMLPDGSVGLVSVQQQHQVEEGPTPLPPTSSAVGGGVSVGSQGVVVNGELEGNESSSSSDSRRSRFREEMGLDGPGLYAAENGSGDVSGERGRGTWKVSLKRVVGRCKKGVLRRKEKVKRTIRNCRPGGWMWP